jgi:hypothetical protein
MSRRRTSPTFIVRDGRVRVSIPLGFGLRWSFRIWPLR